MYPQHLWLPIFVPKQAYHGAAEMSQMLRALAILQDNADLIPSTHMVFRKHLYCQSSSRVWNTLFCPLGTLNICNAQTYIQTKQPYT